VSDTSLVYNVVGRDKGANALIARTAGNVRASNMLAKASTVAFGVAAASAGANLLAMAAASIQAAGAAALIPGALGAAAGILATAKIATFGLSDAWKATGQAAATGGGGAVEVAKRVASAQRDLKAATQALADAQRAALDAQVNLTRSRVDEATRIRDLAVAQSGARIDEEAAVRAVEKAQQDLNAARGSGNADKIKDATIAYEQAGQSLTEVRNRVTDLGRDRAKADRDGVEGSDQVQQALRQQEAAQRQVTDATQRLADAQLALRDASKSAASGGINPAAEALAKLAPSARALILTLRSLGSTWHTEVTSRVQNRVFAGVAGDVRALSSVYLPIMRTRLTQVGAGFNQAIRESMGLARSKGFAADVNSILGATATTTDRLARAVRPVVNGVMQFVAVGVQFLPGIAGSTLSIAQRFERWAVAARESGKIKDWIGNAVAVLRQLGTIAVNAGASVMAIFKASDANAGKGVLDSLVKGSAALRQWLTSAKGQEQVRNTLATLRDILTNIGRVLPDIAKNSGTFSDTLKIANPLIKFLADHIGTVAAFLPTMALGFVALRTAKLGSDVIDGPIRLVSAFSNFGLRGALRANTDAIKAQGVASKAAALEEKGLAVATAEGDAVRKRGIISTVAAKIAAVATSAATKAWAATQWLLNLAMSANPIGLIIIGVALLIGGIVLLWKHSETFRKIVIGVWNGIKDAAMATVHWFTNTAWPLIKKFFQMQVDAVKSVWDAVTTWFGKVVGFITGLPKRLSKAASGMWNGIKDSFRAAINWMIGKWNDFHLTIGGGSVMGINIPSVTLDTPNLPMLAAGGRLTRGGAAIVGDGGEPEIVTLPTGAQVTPLSRAQPGGVCRHVFDVTGADEDMKRLIRRLLRNSGLATA
jgi:phage-related protein